MNQSQVNDVQVKLSLEINDKITLKYIPAVQTVKDLITHAINLCPEHLRSEKIFIHYFDSDRERIDVSDDSDLQMAYAMALSTDRRIKFHIVLPQSALQQEESKLRVV